MIPFLAVLIVNSESAKPFVVPLPQEAVYQEGVCRVASLAFEVRGKNVPPSLARLIAKELKELAPGSDKPSVSIKPELNRHRTDLGSEGYEMVVGAGEIRLSAPSEAGLFYGLQTLKQLVQNSADRSLPCVRIEDKPRFSWRGAHLDVARHFMPLPFLYKLVDLLALHKMNVLHLHLTDDQGWRFEIKRYPRLTSVGSKRADTQINDRPDQFSGKPHAGFYTQAQMRKLVRYASERFVTIVPEIEMPGHSQAAIAAYPELGNTGRQLEVATGWGVHVDILNVEDSTIQFYKNVLEEVLDVFPSKYIHIGGDEAPKEQWKSSPSAQRKMRSLGLKTEDELQSWFIRQMDEFLSSRGRRLVGWDEIIEGGLAKGAVVMSWRDAASAVQAAQAGHDVVLADHRWTYLDQAQTNDPTKELKRSWGHLSLARAFSYDPVPKTLDKPLVKHVLGAQAALWTEVIPDPETAEYQLFPRLCALAEAFWAAKPDRDYADFHRRLSKHLQLLRRMKVNMHPVDPLLPHYVGFLEEIGHPSAEKTYDWDLTRFIDGTGRSYTVEFTYCGGNQGLAISGVSIWIDGRQAAASSEIVKIDPWNGEGKVKLSIAAVPKGAKYALRLKTTVPKDTVVEVRLKPD